MDINYIVTEISGQSPWFRLIGIPNYFYRGVEGGSFEIILQMLPTGDAIVSNNAFSYYAVSDTGSFIASGYTDPECSGNLYCKGSNWLSVGTLLSGGSSYEFRSQYGVLSFTAPVSTTTTTNYNSATLTFFVSTDEMLQQGFRSDCLIFDKTYTCKNNDLVITITYRAFSEDNQLDGGFVVGMLPFYRVVPDGFSASSGLCYSSVPSLSTVVDGYVYSLSADGIKDAQLGIGFDFDGKFSTTRTGSGGNTTATPNSICLRGPANDYAYITSTANLSTSAFSTPFTLFSPSSSSVTTKDARIRITDFGKRVIVDLREATQEKYYNYINTELPTAITTCNRFYIGFTCQNTAQKFQIENVNINGYDVTVNYLVSGAYYMGLSSSTSTLYPLSSLLLNVGDYILIENYFGENPSTYSTLYSTYSSLGDLILVDNDSGIPYTAEDGYILIDYGECE